MLNLLIKTSVMKYLTFTLVLIGALSLTACGWSENQKKAARKSIDEGFTQGFDGSGVSVDPKVKEAWLDCVMDKIIDRWTFDEITEKPKLMDGVRDECANEVGLYDALEVQ